VLFVVALLLITAHKYQYIYVNRSTDPKSVRLCEVAELQRGPEENFCSVGWTAFR